MDIKEDRHEEDSIMGQDIRREGAEGFAASEILSELFIGAQADEPTAEDDKSAIKADESSVKADESTAEASIKADEQVAEVDKPSVEAYEQAAFAEKSSANAQTDDSAVQDPIDESEATNDEADIDPDVVSDADKDACDGEDQEPVDTLTEADDTKCAEDIIDCAPEDSTSLSGGSLHANEIDSADNSDTADITAAEESQYKIDISGEADGASDSRAESESDESSATEYNDADEYEVRASDEVHEAENADVIGDEHTDREGDEDALTDGATESSEADSADENGEARISDEELEKEHYYHETQDPIHAERRSASPRLELKEGKNDKGDPAEQLSIFDIKERTEEPSGKRLINGIFDFLELFVFTLAAVVILLSFFFRHSVVDGDSMLGTLHNGEHLIISDLFYSPSRGDIVVFEDHTTGFNKPLIKRIIAVGGDEIRISGRKVYLNGKLLEEDYVLVDGYYNDVSMVLVVPEGEVFVMGDHRNESSDSRAFGTIKEDSIIGRVILRFYPFDTFGRVDD